MVRISVEVSDEVANELSRLAQGRGSTPEAMLSHWVAEAVSDRAELERRLAAGLADIEAGSTIPHEEVMADLEGWAAGIEKRTRTTQ